MRTRQSPRLTNFLLLPILYFAAAKISQLTVMPEGIAMVWLPNGVLLTAFIRFQGRGMLYFSVLALVSEVLADLSTFTLIEAFIFGLTNIVESASAYALLKTWRSDPRFQTSKDWVKFVLAGPVIAAFVATCFGALVYARFGNIETSYFEYLRIWWFGDALGLLILTPALLSMGPYGSLDAKRPVTYRRTDGLALLLMLTVLTLLMLSQGGKLLGVHIGPILFLPFVLFAAARLSLRWTALMVLAVAFTTIGLMIGGLAPFGSLPAAEAVIQAQEFILVMSFMAIGLATLLSQLRARQEEIAALNTGLERRVKERTSELEHALAQVTQLQGLLPICSSCKKIRDEQNHWHQLEKYITERTEARFSHGYCPECFAKEMQKL